MAAALSERSMGQECFPGNWDVLHFDSSFNKMISIDIILETSKWVALKWTTNDLAEVTHFPHINWKMLDHIWMHNQTMPIERNRNSIKYITECNRQKLNVINRK